MSFVSIWKVLSIVLTGLFGILGLLKDYKDKQTGRVTKWGTIALLGIVVSATFGTVAQVEDQRHEDSARAKDAAQTLEIARRTELAVSDIQRLLNPISATKLSIAWQVDCENPLFHDVCKNESDKKRIRNGLIPLASFREFRNVFAMPIRVSVFKDSQQAENYVLSGNFGTEMAGDLDYDIVASAVPDPKNSATIAVKLYSPKHDDNIELLLPSQSPVTVHSSGRIVGLKDLIGTTVVIADFSDALYGLRLDAVGIQNMNSENMFLSGSSCQLRPMKNVMYSVCKFPDDMNGQNEMGIYLADQSRE